jgi:hypothetical protein
MPAPSELSSGSPYFLETQKKEVKVMNTTQKQKLIGKLRKLEEMRKVKRILAQRIKRAVDRKLK